MPAGWVVCATRPGSVATLCRADDGSPPQDRGTTTDDVLVVRTGDRDALPELGAAVAVGRRTGWVEVDGTTRVLTVSDRSSDDTHYRVVAPLDVATDQLVAVVRSIPRFAAVTDDR